MPICSQCKRTQATLLSGAIVIAVLSLSGFAASLQKVIDLRLLEAETRLSDLGYWVLKIDGLRDASTAHAIMAFEKVEKLRRTGKLDDGVLEAIRTAARPRSRFNTGRSHVEIDITRQVLFLTDEEGVVFRILPISTGNEKRYFDQGKWQTAHTPRGTFKIIRKVAGVRIAPIGNLYYPSYFYGGIAIHGRNSVPSVPASHGCVRIPRFADRAFSAAIPIGTEVFVYD